MPAVNNQLIGWLAKPLAGVRCLLRFRHRIKCWRCQQNGHGDWLCSRLPADRSEGLVKNGAAFISLVWHRCSGRGLCVGSSLSWAKGEENRDKITTLCLSSKSSGGVEVFQMKLEPWQLQMMSLFCHKSPQLPSGTDRSELMGLSTPWKVATAVIGGSLMTDHRLSGERTGGYVLLSENGPSLPFPSIPFPSQRMQVIHPPLSHCCSNGFWTWVDLFALSHPDGKGKGKSRERSLELCLPSLPFWRRPGSRKQSRRDAGLHQTLIYTNLRNTQSAIE